MAHVYKDKPYRLWHIPQLPMEPFIVESDDLDYLVKLRGVLADYDLFQYENKVKPDYANDSGIEVWDTKWQEWVDYDEDYE